MMHGYNGLVAMVTTDWWPWLQRIGGHGYNGLVATGMLKVYW